LNAFDMEPLPAVLKEIREWVDQNPNDLLFLELETWRFTDNFPYDFMSPGHHAGVLQTFQDELGDRLIRPSEVAQVLKPLPAEMLKPLLLPGTSEAERLKYLEKVLKSLPPLATNHGDAMAYATHLLSTKVGDLLKHGQVILILRAAFSRPGADSVTTGSQEMMWPMH
jgi:hypothetical protein